MSAKVPVKFYYSDIPAPQGSATFYAEFTSIVQSASFDNGKRLYSDSVGLPSASIVIRNDNNEAKRFEIGTWIKIEMTANAGAGSQMLFGFLVESISYNDTPGLLAGSTATLELISVVSRLGRMNVTNMVFASAETFTQLNQFNSSSGVRTIASGGSTMDDYMTFSRPVGYSDNGLTLGGRTYSGTILQFLQTAVATENSHVHAMYPVMIVPSFVDHDRYFSTASLTFNRTVSSTSIGYEQLSRDFFDSELANQVTVTPAGLSGQTQSNATSMALYDARSYSRGTFDNATATALGLAGWLANAMSDRAVQIYTIRFTAEAQDQTALGTLFLELYSNRIGFQLVTRPPGSTNTIQEWVFVVGMRIEMTPDRSIIEMTLHPANLYCPAKIGSSFTQITETGTSRTNLLPNPSAEDNTTGWTGTNATISSGTYPFTFIGTRSVKATISAVSATQNVSVGDGDDLDQRLVVLPSQQYIFSAYVYIPTTNTADSNFRIAITGYDITGAATTGSFSSFVTLVRGTWNRLSVTYTTSSTTVRLLGFVQALSNLAVGQVFYVDNAMIERGSTLGEYFDGSMRPAEWLGTRNNSASLLEYGYYRLGRNVA